MIGNDGAGMVVALGDAIKRFQVGDRVYAYTMRGGFYAEYVAVGEDEVALIPPGVGGDEAGALGADGITALRGLDDELRLRAGETLMIYGASGGIGHLAVQLAKRIGARVLAVASGADGVALSRHLGADRAVDGHRDDVRAAARTFAPGGIDAALVLVGGDGADAALKELGLRARVAYPNGVEPPPLAPEGATVLAYDGTPTLDAFERLNRLIGPIRSTSSSVGCSRSTRPPRRTARSRVTTSASWRSRFTGPAPRLSASTDAYCSRLAWSFARWLRCSSGYIDFSHAPSSRLRPRAKSTAPAAIITHRPRH